MKWIFLHKGGSAISQAFLSQTKNQTNKSITNHARDKANPMSSLKNSYNNANRDQVLFNEQNIINLKLQTQMYKPI